ALVRRLVREHRTLDEVADRVDAFDGGPHAVVDFDHAALTDLHAGPVETELLDVRPAAGSDAEVFELLLFTPVAQLHGVLARLDFLHPSAGDDGDVLLAE